MSACCTMNIILCVIALWCMSDSTALAEHCKASTALTTKNVTINDPTGKYLYWGCQIQIPATSQ